MFCPYMGKTYDKYVRFHCYISTIIIMMIIVLTMMTMISKMMMVSLFNGQVSNGLATRCQCR